MTTQESRDGRTAFKIGVAIPCYVNDKHLLPACLQAISDLDPPPFTHLVDLNRGEGGLRAIRTRVFDKAFETCDVVLHCDVDFYLFTDILSHVRRDKVTSFCFLTGNYVGDILKMMVRLVSRRPWTGCYSLPKNIWQKIKASSIWDGTDTSIQEIAKDYVFVHTPKYYLLRRSPRRIDYALGKRGVFAKAKSLVLRGIF